MSSLITSCQVRKWLPKRPQKAHKGDFGRVLVVAGSRSMCGAGLLCAKSALTAGAGLVYWALPQSMQPAFAAALPEVITLPLPENEAGQIDESAWELFPEICEKYNPSLAVVGPGMGASPLLPVLLQNISLPLIVDADALNALARTAGWTKQWPQERPAIFTPHAAELARLLHDSIAKRETKRMTQADALAQFTKAVVIGKGSPTWIFAYLGKKDYYYRNSTGNCALAKGGSGDVLSGVVAGLWAQIGTAEGFSAKTALKAAVCGVCLHGLAGDFAAHNLSEYSVLASDVITHLSHAFRRLREIA